jgi:translocation and assembly module TamA
MSFLQKIFISLIYCCALSLAFANPANPAQLTLNFKIHGIQGSVLKNTEARLAILKNSQGELTAAKIQNIYSQVPNNIRLAIQPYGYFRPSIQSHLSQNNETWTASFHIQPGQRIPISQFSLSVVGPGKSNAGIQHLIHHFPIKVGDAFLTSTYEKAKENLFVTANKNGYIQAVFLTNKILIDVNKYEVKIILVLQTGPQYFFGKMTFKDNSFAQDFLQRFTTGYENTIYSSEKLLKLQQSLSSTAYFKNVVVTPKTNESVDNHVPIEIAITEPKAKKYNIGIGYGTFTGPRLTTGVSFRRLTDTGQHFDAQLKLSSVLSALGAKYYIPGNNPLTDQWIVGLSTQRFIPQNGSSSSGVLTGGYVTKTDHTETSIDLNFLVEQYKVKHMPVERSHFLYPNLNFSYNKNNDIINPTSGKSFNINLRGATQALFSSTNFLQAEVKGKYLYTPVDFAHLIFRANFGYTVTKNLKELPLSMRFFAGGMNTIRGYPVSSIGPGKYLYVGSIEYQNRIINNWWGAAFYDAGTATNHFGSHIYQGAGLGVVYQSMLGPIKLYVAQAVNKRGKPYSFEFSIGPEF